MEVPRWLVGSLSVLALLGAPPAHAEKPAVLWYRSAENCPDEETFVRLLGDEASLVRLARAGDHVDFLVTFIAGDGSVSGRLERQTAAGTVAIREIGDVSCDSVAGVLALGLQLALRSSDAPSTPPSPEAASDRGAPEDGTDVGAIDASPSGATTSPTAQPEVAETPSSQGVGGRATPEAPSARSPGSTLSLEALGGMTTEQIDRPAVLGGAFLDVRRTRGGSFHPAARIGVLGSFAARSTAEGPIDHGVLAARVDGCPLLLGTDALELWPCVGAEIGAVRARGARADGIAAGGVWVAVGADLSLRWRVTRGFGLAAGGGLVMPLSRYSLTAGDDELYATAPTGERLWIGALLPLP